GQGGRPLHRSRPGAGTASVQGPEGLTGTPARWTDEPEHESQSGNGRTGRRRALCAAAATPARLGSARLARHDRFRLLFHDADFPHLVSRLSECPVVVPLGRTWSDPPVFLRWA